MPLQYLLPEQIEQYPDAVHPGRRDDRSEIVKPTIGRIVHFVMPEGSRYPGEHRPAIIVKVWSDTPDSAVQLQVFTDGANDGPSYAAAPIWVTSVAYDETGTKERTWHWPERDEA